MPCIRLCLKKWPLTMKTNKKKEYFSIKISYFICKLSFLFSIEKGYNSGCSNSGGFYKQNMLFSTCGSNEMILNSDQICSSHWSCCVFCLSFPPSDIFSMISDSSGVMVYGRYDMFLREVLKLPTAVFEGPSFGYTEQSAKSCFSQQVNEEWAS